LWYNAAVDALKRFEDLIESTIEGSLAEATTAHLQPVEIAKKLSRTLDSAQTIGVSGAIAPNAYLVLVNQRDFDALAPYKHALESELAAYVRAAAAERGLSFVAPPSVALAPGAGVRPRRLRIQASLADAGDAPTAPPTGATARLPVAEVREALGRAAQLMLGNGRAVALDQSTSSLGRQLDNNVVLEDKRVSRHHAQIRFEHRNFCLYDLASANGTFVNGERIEQVVLRDGDIVSLGGLEMIFRRAAAEARRGQ